MSYLISLQTVSMAYGLLPLLDGVNAEIAKGERICFIGRNGTGKSTLLSIIEGQIQPDAGRVIRQTGLVSAKLDQMMPPQGTTVYHWVAQGLAEVGALLSQYHDLTMSLSDEPTASVLEQLEKLHTLIEKKSGWRFDQLIKQVLTALSLNPDSEISALSGGWQRRAALAKALVVSPDLLLLDEPTNHLDMEAIIWLESFLLTQSMTVLFITHDRSFLDRIATQIWELDRGRLIQHNGNYESFLRRKAEALEAESRENDLFDKKLAEEEKWIRQGIKARRTRNEGRVRALKAMRLERQSRREREGVAQMKLNQGAISSKCLFDLEHVSFQYHEQIILRDFTFRIMRGDRIGLIGPNGCGKSTLIHLLLKRITPTAGTMTQGNQLTVAYFDQLRASLNLSLSVIDNVREGSDFIECDGKRKHIISYLSDFLFTRERAFTPLDALSGGERNRVLLAKLFSRPSNVLILDEPTNDLDIETIELLETLLSDYAGTIILVSHDRAFLNSVVTSLLVFEGDGKVTEYIGGYDDWMLQTKQHEKFAKEKKSLQASLSVEKAIHSSEISKTRASTKLSYKEQSLLQSLPNTIEALEEKIKLLEQTLEDPLFYQEKKEVIDESMLLLKKLNEELMHAYTEWEVLDAKSRGDS